jgi:hypothetical protein
VGINGEWYRLISGSKDGLALKDRKETVAAIEKRAA